MRLPPALAASVTPRILELLGPPPGRILELGFAGIHAAPLRLAGFEVVVVEPDPAHLAGARARAGGALPAPPPHERFDVVVAPEGSGLGAVGATRALLVARDGSITERRHTTDTSL